MNIKIIRNKIEHHDINNWNLNFFHSQTIINGTIRELFINYGIIKHLCIIISPTEPLFLHAQYNVCSIQRHIINIKIIKNIIEVVFGEKNIEIIDNKLERCYTWILHCGIRCKVLYDIRYNTFDKMFQNIHFANHLIETLKKKIYIKQIKIFLQKIRYINYFTKQNVKHICFVNLQSIYESLINLSLLKN